MKINYQCASIMLMVFIAMFSACSNNSSRQQPPPNAYGVVDSNKARADTICFERTQGLIHTDITTISLYINKGDVTGHMILAPAGKYSSIGTLAGNKKDSLISASWAYVRQGKPDTLNLQFKLLKDKLYQQPFTKKSAKEKLSIDSTAAWFVEYHRVECVRPVE